MTTKVIKTVFLGETKRIILTIPDNLDTSQRLALKVSLTNRQTWGLIPNLTFNYIHELMNFVENRLTWRYRKFDVVFVEALIYENRKPKVRGRQSIQEQSRQQGITVSRRLDRTECILKSDCLDKREKLLEIELNGVKFMIHHKCKSLLIQRLLCTPEGGT